MSKPTRSWFIYRIINTVSGKVYVGQSVTPRERWTEHKRRLRLGTHFNAHLQAAWAKYGETAWVFEVLEEVATQAAANLAEARWIETFTSISNGYNVRPGGNVSELTVEHKQNLRRAHLGKTLSLEHRAKLGASRRGDRNGMFGRTHSTEARQKISAARRGRSHPHTPESRAKISAANTRRWAAWRQVHA